MCKYCKGNRFCRTERKTTLQSLRNGGEKMGDVATLHCLDCSANLICQTTDMNFGKRKVIARLKCMNCYAEYLLVIKDGLPVMVAPCERKMN